MALQEAKIVRSKRVDTRNLRKVVDGILDVKAALRKDYNKESSTEKLQNRRQRSPRVFHCDAIANGCLAGSSACPELSKFRVVDLDDDDNNGIGCLGCRIPSAPPKTFVRRRKRMFGSLEVLTGQRVIGEREEEGKGTAHISEGGRVCNMMDSKLLIEKEQKADFKSMLAVEIKRQILSWLRDMKQGTIQELEVMEVEDIVSCNAESIERIGSACNEQYIAKVKLMATVCVPILLQEAYNTKETRKLPQHFNESMKCAGLEVSEFKNELHNFDLDRREDNFAEGQVWALYDENRLPRHYAKVTRVYSIYPFEVGITWLEPKLDSTVGLMRLVHGNPLTCGEYELRKQQYPIRITHVEYFSHRLKAARGPYGEIVITPSKGEVWALYGDQIAFHYGYERATGKYDLVQVVDMDKALGVVTAMPLVKVACFQHRFVQEHWPFKIAQKDFRQFSHQIPAWELKEGPKVYVELDPASAPLLSASPTPKTSN